MNEPIDLPTPPVPSQQKPPQSKHSLRWILIGVLGVALVGAAAFTAGRLLNGGTIPGFPGGVLSLGPNASGVSMSLDTVPAAELPTTPSDANGVFLKREDNVLTIGTGGGSTVIVNNSTGSTSASSGPLISSEHSGPDIDIVVTKDTHLYRDATFDQYKDPPKDGEKIQQKVEVGAIEDIGSQSMLTIWGRKSGNRIIADVILFSKPVLFVKKN